MRRLLDRLARVFDALGRKQYLAPPPPDGHRTRVVPPVWASDDDLALLRKAGLL